MINGNPKRIAVVGAGPAGLTCAYLLAKSGYDVDLFEASEQVGGLCRTFELWGQFVDLGPHRFFSEDPRVNELWLEMAQNDYRQVDRLTRILYKERFFHYPLQVVNVLANLGPFEAIRCVLSYLREVALPRVRDGSFEDWVVSRFGRRLYEIFFKTYSEKLWGLTGKQLDEAFAAQRIKKLSFFEAVKNALFKGRDNKHKTLVDQFAYPVAGTGMIYQRMADRFKGHGGKLYLNSRVTKLLKDDGRVNGLMVEGLGPRYYDEVVSSMPLTLAVQSLDDIPLLVQECCEKLRFRSTILVYLLIDRTDLFLDNWLYVHSPDVLCGRITNFRNWVPELYGDDDKTILALEYWCNEGDDQWSRDDKGWRAAALADLDFTGLVSAKDVVNYKVVRIRRCYPIYERGYGDYVQVIGKYLDTLDGLQVIGRYGSFKYNNQDHSILMGRLAAENISANKNHNLWQINTDDEYQESALVSESGLAPSKGSFNKAG